MTAWSAPSDGSAAAFEPTAPLRREVWLGVAVAGAVLGAVVARTATVSVATIEWILICTAALAALVAGSRSPRHAFDLLLVTLPFENALVFTSVFTVTPGHLALLLLLTCSAVYAFRGRVVGRLYSPLHPFVLAYLGVSLVSIIMTIVAPPPPSSAIVNAGLRATEFRPVIQVCLLFFLSISYFAAVYFVSDTGRLKRAWAIYLMTAALVSLYGIYQMIATVYYLPMVANLVQTYYFIVSSFRPNATFREPLNFGHYLLSALPIAMALFLGRDRFPRTERAIYGVGLAPVILVMIVALLATIARGAWFGFIGAVGVLALLDWRRAARTAPIAAGVAVLALFTIARAYGSWQLMFLTMWDRFRFTNPVNIAAEQRLTFLPFLLQVAKEHPTLGVGYGNYPLYQLDRFGGGIAGAYGVFFQALVESGVIGLAALLALVGAYYVIMLRAIRRAKDSEWAPWLTGCVAAFTGLMIQHFTFGDRFSLYVWVFMGLSMATVNVVNAELDRDR